MLKDKTVERNGIYSLFRSTIFSARSFLHGAAIQYVFPATR